MKYPVIRTFRDKFTKIIHDRGSFYETEDPRRGLELQRLGFVGEAEQKPDEPSREAQDAQLKPLGGGYYELPNGERIRGKANALAALKGEAPHEGE